MKILKTKRGKSSEKNHNKKFQQLYDYYKYQKTKEERYRQRILSEREKKELAECTFSKICKNKPFEALTQKERDNNKIKAMELLKTDENIANLIDRQNKWLEKKIIN